MTAPLTKLCCMLILRTSACYADQMKPPAGSCTFGPQPQLHPTPSFLETIITR